MVRAYLRVLAACGCLCTASGWCIAVCLSLGVCCQWLCVCTASGCLCAISCGVVCTACGSLCITSCVSVSACVPCVNIRAYTGRDRDSHWQYTPRGTPECHSGVALVVYCQWLPMLLATGCVCTCDAACVLLAVCVGVAVGCCPVRAPCVPISGWGLSGVPLSMALSMPLSMSVSMPLGVETEWCHWVLSVGTEWSGCRRRILLLCGQRSSSRWQTQSSQSATTGDPEPLRTPYSNPILTLSSISITPF